MPLTTEEVRPFNYTWRCLCMTMVNLLSSFHQIRWDGRVNKTDGLLRRKGWDFIIYLFNLPTENPSLKTWVKWLICRRHTQKTFVIFRFMMKIHIKTLKHLILQLNIKWCSANLVLGDPNRLCQKLFLDSPGFIPWAMLLSLFWGLTNITPRLHWCPFPFLRV